MLNLEVINEFNCRVAERAQLQLKKTHANRKNTSILIKHLNLFHNTCAANTHNTTKYRIGLQILTMQPNTEMRS